MAAFKIGAMRTEMETTKARLQAEPKSPKRDAMIKKIDTALKAMSCGQTMIIDI